MIACKTIIGFGAPTKAGTKEAHGAPLGKDEIAGARQNLGWPYPPFEIPAAIVDARGGTAGTNGNAAGGNAQGGNGGDGGAQTTNGGTLKLFYNVFSGTKPTSRVNHASDPGTGYVP